MLIGFLLATSLNGCGSLQRPSASYSYDHAFIRYWPPSRHSGILRLAVKDLIDMKGVVTTAGSKYVAETSQPATSDAACLMIARTRNVQIVGKTNLSEFAVAPSGINDFFGTPKSPLNKDRNLIPGGSSCGSP
jgi:amidase